MENVTRFFELYDNDEALRHKVETALALYPGSLEIRDAVAQHVLLPIAEELGLPFELADLRKYETRKKMRASIGDEISGDIDEGQEYWLLDRGWSTADDKYK